jgi:hypothetical protein
LPLGYTTSYAYLRCRAGPLDRDEVALIRAVDRLTASRVAWLTELNQKHSRAQKGSAA